MTQLTHIRDLRGYIDALRAIGDIQDIDREVDWNLEIGAITRRSIDLRAPAPLFNAITGIEPGFRALGAPAAASGQPGMPLARVAISLGLDPHAHGGEIIRALADARTRPGIPPRVVATGPCKENILLGDDIDLLRLPAPIIHGEDGGRFINTWGIVIVQTPDGSWTNWSITRQMVFDRTRMTGLVVPNQHVGMIDAQWKALGKPTPFVAALGVEPVIPFVGGMPLPEGADEGDYIGALLGEPIDVVKCETVDLYVPASAEIVLEGHISHDETLMEGPFGEYGGYISPGSGSPKAALNITAMTFRDDPILPVIAAGPPIEEDHTGWGLPHAAEAYHELRNQHGLPISMVWMALESANHWLVVAVEEDWHTKVAMSGSELCRAIGDVVFGSKIGNGIPKILVMEDDVDITDINQVVWAFATRASPGNGEEYFQNESTTNLPIFLSHDEKRYYHATKVVHNCLYLDELTPEERPGKVTFRDGWPQEIQDRVLRNWEAYGYAPANGTSTKERHS